MINDAILFLEVDPWYFRAGYLKERLIDELKGAPLAENDRRRLQQVIINVIGGRNRREFSRFCKLAAKITSSDFENQLTQLANDPNFESKGKPAYLITYLDQHKHS